MIEVSAGSNLFDFIDEASVPLVVTAESNTDLLTLGWYMTTLSICLPLCITY